MKSLPNIFFLLSLFVVKAAASPVPATEECRATLPPAFFLTGDSTTAAQSCCGGGWGNGFLTTLHNAIGTNFGHNGATTVSFVSGADWADALESVGRYSKSWTPYVTIQFGHNDQKASSNISLQQYTTNLHNLATEVQAAGGHPVLVTPLSRRNYNSSNLIIQDLAPQRQATISVAQSLSVPYIDLNLASTNYLNAIGKSNAITYNLAPTDMTHLNPHGSLLFGNMVSGLLTEALGANVKGYLNVNATIWDAIQKGRFILP